MNTATYQNQAAYFVATPHESLPPPAMKPTRRFVPAARTAKLRFVPNVAVREKLCFVPRATKPSRAAAPSEPTSMMRIGSIGIVAFALVSSVLVTSSAPASSHLPPAAEPEPRADVEFATEVPTPVVEAAPVVAPAPAVTRSVTRPSAGATRMAPVAAPSRAEANVDELTDGPVVVVPIEGPRANPF